MESTLVQVGVPFPPFTLENHLGKSFSSDQLFGDPAIIYFYPKDDTPGCTQEACCFRDVLEQLDTFNTRVIGISPDSVESHARFHTKYQLNFPLLSDKDALLAKALGIWKEKNLYGKKSFGVERTTFLIDSEGVIRWMEKKVKVEGHIERILEAISSLELDNFDGH